MVNTKIRLIIFFVATDWASLVALMVRFCLQCRRPAFSPWVGKIPCRRAWQPTPIFLPGESYGQRSLVNYSPGSCKELDLIERLSTAQPKMKLCIVSKNKPWSWLRLRSRTPYCKIQAQIEESRGNHYVFRYDLNHILYDYTVKVPNRFKGLDLIQYMKNYEQKFITLYIPKKKKYKKATQLSEEVLQIAEERREVKSKGERERHSQLKADF